MCVARRPVNWQGLRQAFRGPCLPRDRRNSGANTKVRMSVPRTAGLREAYRRDRAGEHLLSWPSLRLPGTQLDSQWPWLQHPFGQYPVSNGDQPAKDTAILDP